MFENIWWLDSWSDWSAEMIENIWCVDSDSEQEP